MSLFVCGFSTPALLKRLRGANSCGDPAYAPPLPVSGRFQPGVSRAITPQGEELTSSATFLSYEALSAGDVLTLWSREYTVRAVTPVLSLYGSIDHWEAAL